MSYAVEVLILTFWTILVFTLQYLKLGMDLIQVSKFKYIARIYLFSGWSVVDNIWH